MTLGIGLLYGPRGERLLMSEVPLEAFGGALHTTRHVQDIPRYPASGL